MTTEMFTISMALACVLGYGRQAMDEIQPSPMGGNLDPVETAGGGARLTSNPETVPMVARTRTSQTKFRRAVFVRDAGKCALCGLMCADAHCELETMYREIKRGDRSLIETYLATLAEYGVERPSLDFPPTLWEADHIVPLVEGGTNDIANGRTLCLACHRQATIALLRRLYCDHWYDDAGTCVVCGSAA